LSVTLSIATSRHRRKPNPATTPFAETVADKLARLSLSDNAAAAVSALNR